MTEKKGPGRPRKEPRRRRRNVGGYRVKMSAPKIPGFETYWANDIKNRIHELTVEDDWDFVTKEEVTKDGRVDVGDPDISNVVAPGESRVSIPVGTHEGQPLYAYLLKKKKEYYDADKKEASKRIDEVEKQLHRTNMDKGNLDINRQP